MIDYIKHCKNLVVGGDGELFCSKYYMQILAEDLSGCELKTITLMSNGLLFNEQNWNKIHPNNRKMINVVRISIDAATKETYEMLREGSKWDILQKNLAYLQQLKQEYGFELHSNFTISKWNYKEMVEFPNLMLKFGFDILLFSYADQEFRVGQDLHNKFTIDDKTFAECEELIKMLSADYVEKGLTII